MILEPREERKPLYKSNLIFLLLLLFLFFSVSRLLFLFRFLMFYSFASSSFSSFLSPFASLMLNNPKNKEMDELYDLVHRKKYGLGAWRNKFAATCHVLGGQLWLYINIDCSSVRDRQSYVWRYWGWRTVKVSSHCIPVSPLNMVGYIGYIPLHPD